MSTITEQFDDLKAKFSGLGKTFQRLLYVGIAALVYMVLDTYLIQPMLTDYQTTSETITKSRTERKNLEKEIRIMSAQLGVDPDLAVKEQIAAMQQQLKDLEKAIQTASDEFVRPSDMKDFLKDILRRNDKLELISMEKLPLEFNVVKTVKQVEVEAQPAKKGKKAPATLMKEVVIAEDKVYRHGVELIIRGKYVDIINYIRNVERLPWRVFWEESSLQTESYPLSKMSFKIYTLSLDENWLTL